MKTLLDTNVLARMTQREHPQQTIAIKAVELLRKRGDQLLLVPQILYEFWVICTRPIEQNGLGLSTKSAEEKHRQAKTLFFLMPETETIFPVWESLVETNDIKGKNAHDARLIAAMKAHSISTLLTFNVSDFARYVAPCGITIINPANVDALVAQ